MYGTPYIFHFVHPSVKTAEIMVQRVNFERNLKNICPPTVCSALELQVINEVTANDRFSGNALFSGTKNPDRFFHYNGR